MTWTARPRLKPGYWENKRIMPGQHVYIYSQLPWFGKTYQLSKCFPFFNGLDLRAGTRFIDPVVVVDNYDEHVVSLDYNFYRLLSRLEVFYSCDRNCSTSRLSGWGCCV